MKIRRFGMHITITPMTVEHLDAVVAIECELFTDPWSRTMFFQDLNTEYVQSFVALEHDRIAAYIHAWLVSGECTINRIGCCRNSQRRGIASLLLKYLITTAILHGAQRFLLEVRSANTVARNFYTHAGFIEDGVRRAYYTDTRDDAVLMSLNACSAEQT